MKRILSFILSVAMIITLLPASIAVNQDGQTYLYKFFSDTHGYSGKISFSPSAFSVDNTADGFDKWGYVGACYASGWSINAIAKANRSDFNFTAPNGTVYPPTFTEDKLTALCFEIEAEEGTYTPRVTWVNSELGATAQFYLIEKPESGVFDTEGKFDTAKFKKYILSDGFDENLIGFGDFSLKGGRRENYIGESLSDYTKITNKHGKTMQDVTLSSAGNRYYLIAVMTGKGAEAQSSGNMWGTTLLAFSLTPADGTSTVGNPDVMCKADLAISYPDGAQMLPRGESAKLDLSIFGGFEENPIAIDYSPEDIESITYKSSNEVVLAVSDDGMVTGGTRNGTATVTVTVIYKGVTKEASCDVTVWSAVKYAAVVTTLSDSTLAVGESAKIISTIPKREDGTDADMEDSVVSYSIAEEDREILQYNEENNSITALSEGTGTLITTITASGGITTSENKITVDNRQKVEKVYLYCDESIPIGKTAHFKTSLQLKNGKMVRGGEIVSIELVNESEKGVVLPVEESCSVLGAKAGTAQIRAKVIVRGIEYTTDTVLLSVMEFGKYVGENFSIDFRKGRYVGDSFELLDEAVEYTDYRNWVFDEISGKGEYNKNLLLRDEAFCYVVFDIKNSCPYLAFRVRFPASGKFAVDTCTYNCYRAANTELYVMPANSENLADIPAKLVKDNEYYVGSLDFYSENAIDSATGRYGFANVPEAGEYLVVMKVIPGKAQEIKYFNGDVFYGHYITFTHDSTLDRATLSFAENTETLFVGNSAETVFSMYGGSGNKLEHNADTLETLKYTSSDPGIATVDDSGRITAIREGAATITASVSRSGITKDAVLKIKIEDLSGISENGAFASSDGSVYIYGETQLVVSALMNSGKTADVPAEFVRWKILPESDEDVLEISENGVATGKNIGKAYLKAHILPGWKDGSENLEIAPITVDVVWDASIELTIYTQKERENAKQNASRYTWAKNEVKKATQKADKYVDNAELLYQIMAPEGIPRYYYIGHNYDPNKYFCRYCGANIGLEYGTYGFVADPIARPWKVKCPDCKRFFPSNDFGSFYELGLSEDRTYWNYTDALQRHHEIFVCEDGANCTHTPPAENAPEPGSLEWMDNDPRDAAWREYYGYNIEGGFLTNILYEEMDEKLGISGWGVDDGFGYHQPYIADKTLPGYSTQYSNENGYAWYTDGSYSGPVNYYFIGYYIHEGLWHGGTITAAIEALTDAFVYTGDAKYGRTGVILLDKIADIYPKFDWYKWANWRGNEYRGTMVDPIWGTNIVTSFAAAYDAFKPIYNDPYVVNYLSENGVTYKEEDGGLVIDNPKSSPGALKKNVEDRILRQIYEFALYGDLKGNFGRHQGAVATAAVALNKLPETGEMLEWIMQSGANAYNTGEKRHKISGGDIMNTLVANVDHDGFGNENSPQYNRTWVNNLATVADCLDGYELYPSSDLYNNPIFVRMAMASHRLTLGGYYTAQTGDHGAFADKSVYLSDGVLERIFERTKSVEVAQVLYLNNGNTVEGLHGSIMDDEPEKMTDEIKRIIDEYGTLNLDSELLSGYGFAALRAGGAYDSAVSAGRMNNHRDFALYFGSTDKHGHSDTLNLYMSAFGLNMAPDLGYPEQTGTQPNRIEWVDATISHNTVIVNEASQLPNIGVGKVHHFDDSGKVQVMDVSSDSYPVTDDYRRTFFMIEVSDDISYGVDFFHIKGGNDHMYSFHSQSDELSAVDGLSGLTSYPTYEKDGKLIGTYAGADVAYGACPKDENDNYLYPEGYTWLKDVRTYNVAEEKFSVEFRVKDWNKALKDNRDLRLRLTMLNDDTPEEVSFVTGLPPQIAANKKVGEIEYMLVRNKGTDIDTTFNTVYEPYEKGNEYISAIEKVDMERSVGKPGFTDSYGAVKVTMKSGRVDYIIYSTNTNADYVVDNKIRFRGFGGVISLETKGKTEMVVYSYLNDGEVLSLITEQQENRFPAAYTGEVVSFTKVLSTENSIVYTPDAVTDTSAITGKNVYIENDGITNAVYKIEHAEILEDGNIELHLGNTSPIRSYRDSNDITLVYNYSIAEGQTLRIPMTNTYDTSPEIENVADVSTSVGSAIVIPLSVTSEKEVQIIGTNLPRGMTIDRETMTLRWKPDASQVGDNHVAVTASDGTLETTIHFTVAVYGSTTGSSSSIVEHPSTGGSYLPNDEDSTQSDKLENAPDASDKTNSNRFTDLGNHEWAADAINTLAADGIIKGVTETTFAPASNITRADFAILLVRAFKLTNDNTENFADVTAGDYFATELAIAHNSGIVNGIGENKYAPRNNITRQDMMVIVYRALVKLGIELESEVVDYADFSKVSDYAKDAVCALITSGLVKGKNGKIAPTDYTTRAEVAVLIKRILDLR